ncbi:uncharacterized protein MONBRDRAFT_24618, partial [Monosiga brevicollis MX1]
MAEPTVPVLDVPLAAQRLGQLQQKLAAWNVDVLTCAVSKADEEIMQARNIAFSVHLAGLLISECFFMVTPKTLHVFTGKKKLEYLKPLQDRLGEDSVKLHARNKADGNAENYEKAGEVLEQSKKGVGFVSTRHSGSQGPFLDGFEKLVQKAEARDLGSEVGHLMIVQDDKAMTNSRNAGLFSAYVMQKMVRKTLVTMIQDDERISNAQLAEDLERASLDGRVSSKLNLDGSLDAAMLPIVQSGGRYNIKLNAQSDDKRLRAGVVLINMAYSYNNYCANVARTYLFDPSNEHERTYKRLLEVRDEAIKAVRVGATLGQVYDAAINYLKQEDELLVDHLPRNIGCAIGVELQNKDFVIKSGNDNIIEAGMVLRLNVGFADLEDQGKTFSLLVSDTVLVSPKETTVLTEQAKSDLDSIRFQFAEQDEEAQQEASRRLAQTLGERKSRHENSAVNGDAERADHQAEIRERLEAEVRRRLLNQDDDEGSFGTEKTPIAYTDPTRFPYEKVKSQKIIVDRRHETVILPIHGFATPIHISCIKNVSQTDGEDHSLLRINFNHPGIKNIRPNAENEPEAYLKEITFRSQSAPTLQTAFRLIRDTQKKYKDIELERKRNE